MVSQVHVGASVSATNQVQEAACIASTAIDGYTPPDIFFMPMDAYHDWIASLKEELEIAKKKAEEVVQ